YQELLSALMLAGGRGLKPPPGGFPFPTLLGVNSAPPARVAAHDRDPRPPPFWGPGNFNASPGRHHPQKPGWGVPPPPAGRRPTRPGSVSSRPWTTGTRRGPTAPWSGWSGPRARRR